MTRRIIAAAIAAAVLALPAAVAADDEANIKYRQAVMKSIGGHAGALGALAKGAAGDDSHIATHAQGIADLAKLVSDAFKPKTGDSDKTDSTGKIWEDWSGFEAKAKDLEEATAAVAAAASGGRAEVGGKLKAMFGACKGCHEDFRKPKN